MVVPFQVRDKLHCLKEVASIGKPEGEAILACLTDGHGISVGVQVPEVRDSFLPFDFDEVV